MLGLKNLKMDVPLTTAYLMVGERCVFDCAYCAQARNAKVGRRNLLSRIIWPQYELEEVLHSLHNAPFKRICIQVVNSPRYFENLIGVIRSLPKKIPISVSIRTLNLQQLKALFDEGVDRVGLPLDVASPSLYEKLRGGDFNTARSFIVESAHRFPGKISTHIIVGLGETDREILEVIQEFLDKGILVSLFAFTPVKGTKMESYPPPPLDRYRKIQTAFYLMRKGFVHFHELEFSADGSLITSLDLSTEDRKKAFLTLGCPDCTRPFYNEHPGGTMYNIPTKEGCRVEASDV